MSQHPLERFANNNFLLERARAMLRFLSQRWKQNVLSFTVRVLLFGGLLGLMWTLSHLHPHGDLSLYLIPITLLALPIGFIAPNEHPSERALNWLFLGAFFGCLIWSGIWYFTFYEWGYLLRWFLIESLLLMCLVWVTLKRRPESWDGPQRSLLKTLWQVGVIISLGSLSFLAYYLITQSAPEAGTANILTGTTFLFFLTLTIVRVYWLDGVRLRRANRGEFSLPPDYVLLVEWLIPRSYSFVAVLVMLLVAQSMMFSTIYRTNARQFDPPTPPQLLQNPIVPAQAPEASEASEAPEAPEANEANEANVPDQPSQNDWTDPPLSLPWDDINQNKYKDLDQYELKDTDELKQPRQAPNPVHASSQRSLKQKESIDQTRIGRVDREVNLSEWIFFSFKPYVFPKDTAGREVSAPQWFKVLGRALLGLIIAILLTKQLNIWKQLSALYLTFLGAQKRAHHVEDSEDLQRQRHEMLLGLKAMFNTHATFWRWRLFHAVTAPTLTLSWRVLLDPSSAFFIALERTQRWVGARWDVALFAITIFISLCTTPIAFVDPLVWELYPYAVGPVITAALTIGIMRVLIGLKPPKSYQQWLWWSLLIYVMSALVAFFLALNLGSRTGFWPNLLWYVQICTIGVFPALYVFGGERHRRISELGIRRQVFTNDSDYAIRLQMLQSFMHTEHREWMAHKITHLIHPVRSGSLQLRLLWSSLMLSTLDTLRLLLNQMQRLTRWATQTVVWALSLWIGIQLLAWTSSFLIHLFLYHRLLPSQVVSAYLLNLACLLMPSALPLLYASMSKWRDQPQERSLKAMVAVSILGTVTSMGAWLYLYSTSPVWNETTRYSWFTFIFIHPWLPMFALLKERANDPQEATVSRWQMETLFTKIQAWLQRAESISLQNAYELAHKANPLEFELRVELIKSCARLMELTIEDIKNGRWYEEEGHALQRIYRQWVGISDREAEEQELIEELGYLLEHLLDTLGSLLYDVSVTKRFGDQSLSFGDETPLAKLPYVEVILTTMVRIVQLPHPNNLGPHKGVSLVLDSLYQSLEHLIWTLLLNTHPHLRDELEVYLAAEQAGESLYTTIEPKIPTRAFNVIDDLDANTSRMKTSHERLIEYPDQVLLNALQDEPIQLSSSLSSVTSLLVELLCYLNPSQAHARLILCSSLLSPNEMIRLARDESHSAELLSALVLTQSPELQVQSQLAIWMNQLPTPLASIALQLDQQIDRWQALQKQLLLGDELGGSALSWTDEWQLPTSQQITELQDNNFIRELSSRATTLDRLQSPERFKLLNERLKLRRTFNEVTFTCTESLLACYIATFAYLLVYLKDLIHREYPHEQAYGLYQQLRWDSLEDLKMSLLILKRAKFPDSLSQIQNLILNLFPLTDLRSMERRSASHRDLEKAIKVWHNLIMRFIEEAIPQLPTLVWRQTTSIEAGKVYTLALIGHRPRLIESAAQQWHLGRGIRLKNSDERPLIDFYASIWVLKNLNSLAHSDSLFRIHESQIHEQVSVETLNRLRSLVSRFGRMLRSFAPEEQRMIEELYNHISRRLALFETLTPNELQNFEGQGVVDFEQTYAKVKSYLDGLEGCMHRRFQHLLKLQVLPSNQFLFLTGVESGGEGELHWYDDPYSMSSELTVTQNGESIVYVGGLGSS